MLERSNVHVPYDTEDQSLDPSHYFQILKKRRLYLLLPFIFVFAIGFAVAMLWPPTYVSEARILVESQQIPADLVRPTVTATAKERVLVIEQRVMTRDNLLAIADKYQLYADRRDTLSRTELLDLMRQSTLVKPVDLDPQRRQNENVTIAITVGFSHRQPDVAAKVANELVTLFLNEDARNRTSRAMETTKFLAREVQKLEADIASIDAKISEVRRQQHSVPEEEQRATVAQTGVSQLTTMRAELAQKSAVFSKKHPEVKRLRAQIQALEKVPAPPTTALQAPTRVASTGATQPDSNSDAIEVLQRQRASVQKNLDTAGQKLAAGRLGESLERDQFSERLEILEQAVVPQRPVKPDRPKFIALAFAAAMMAGFGGVLGIEFFDRSIRGSNDLLRVADGQLVVAIPYIATGAELVRKKRRVLMWVALIVVTLLAALAAAHWLVRPLDELWVLFMRRLLGSWTAF